MSEKRVEEFKKNLEFNHRLETIEYTPPHKLLTNCFYVETDTGLKFQAPVGFISDIEKFDNAFSVGRGFVIVIDLDDDNDIFYTELEEIFPEIADLPIHITFGIFSSTKKDVSKIRYKFVDIFEDSPTEPLGEVVVIDENDINTFEKTLRNAVTAFSN
eukprot:gene10252-2671_t